MIKHRLGSLYVGVVSRCVTVPNLLAMLTERWKHRARYNSHRSSQEGGAEKGGGRC